MDSKLVDDTGKLVLRLALGVLILFHGVVKLIGGISSIEGMVASAGLPVVLAYGVYLGEIVGPILLNSRVLCSNRSGPGGHQPVVFAVETAPAATDPNSR